MVRMTEEEYQRRGLDKIRPSAPRSSATAPRAPQADHARGMLTLIRQARMGGAWLATPDDPETEYAFAAGEVSDRWPRGRAWRFDLAWVVHLVAVEVDGGGWVAGRHARGGGMDEDAEKLSTAAALGWRVLRVTPKMMEDGSAVGLLERALRWPEGAA